MAIPPRNKRKARSSPEQKTQPPEPPHNPDLPSSSSSSSAADNFSSPSTKPFVFPPGFRFVPKDEELILHYLRPILRGNRYSFLNVPIHHVNIYHFNPEQLSEEFEKGNEKEWFFISERTKISQGGKLMSRRDNGGYWSATSAAKKINAGEGVVGYKTALQYYVGKQPNGVKGDWLMHEYWFESNKMVDHALCKIYLTPQAAKKKKEENEKQKKDEGTTMVHVEAALQEDYSYENQDGHDDNEERANHALCEVYLIPKAAKKKKIEEEEKEKLKKEEGIAIIDVEALKEEVEQPPNVEYQLPHQPQPYDIAYQQLRCLMMMMLGGEHCDVTPQQQQQQQQQGTPILPPPPQGQASGFEMVTTTQNNDYNNIMPMSNQEHWLDMPDGTFSDFDELNGQNVTQRQQQQEQLNSRSSSTCGSSHGSC